VGENATNTILSYDLYAGIANAEGKPIGPLLSLQNPKTLNASYREN
jgi:hypothetical protein